MKNFYLLLLLIIASQVLPAQTNVWDFESVEPNSQTAQFVFPNATHTFQYLLEENTPDVNGINTVSNTDFTGYVPIEGSSTNGYVSVNGETTPGGVTILDVNYDETTQLWNVPVVTAVDFDPVGGTARNCSGGVTPWGTILTAEETVDPTPHSDGHNSLGWLVEVDPATKSVIGKVYGAGNFSHENAAVHIGAAADNRVVYTGADQTQGFVCKFIADNPTDLTSGSLYVLDVASGATTGSWIQVPNFTTPDQNATAVTIPTLTQNFFDGVEDVEVAADGYIYFTAKGDRATYRFREKDDDPFATEVEQFEVYVGSESAFNGGTATTVSYEIEYAGGTKMLEWGANDNLALDNNNNLWVLMDGGSENEIIVVENGHTQENPKVKLFAISPSGSEPTGLTFSPDNRFMFLSIQHPSSDNVAQQTDASGAIRDFNKDVTLVMARKENLGAPIGDALALELLALNGKAAAEQIELEWATANERDHAFFTVQRQSDAGEGWSNLGEVATKGNQQPINNYSFVDNKPTIGRNYYRLQQTDLAGNITHSHIIWVNFVPQVNAINLLQNPVNDKVQVLFKEPFKSTMGLFIINAHGQRMKQYNLHAGQTQAEIDVAEFAPGMYYIGTGEGAIQEFVIIR